MRRTSNIRGMTLFEMLIVVTIAVIFATVFATIMTKNITFFRHTQARQGVMMQSNVGMETIIQMLRNGNARTLVISTPDPATTPLVPNSRVDFDFINALPSGATAYAIYLSNGKILTKEYVPPGGGKTPKVLISNVTSLMFGGDSRDPTFVGITLRTDTPLDATKKQFTTLIIPNQVVHMGSVQ